MKVAIKSIVDRDRFLKRIPDLNDRAELARLMEKHEMLGDIAPAHIEPTEVDYAKLAAYIDGEGCFLIVRRKSESRRSHTVHRAEVTVSNTDLRMPLWILARFGGNVFIKNKTPKNKSHWKPLYTWHVAGPEMKRIIRRCLPHFVIKHEQAEVILALHSTARSGQKITPELEATRDMMHNAITAMKRVDMYRWTKGAYVN